MSTPDLSKAVCEPFFRTPRKKHKNSPDKRDGIDDAYLAKIRQLPCAIPGCTRQNIQAHHVRYLDRDRAKGKKAADKYAVPLCAEPHHGYSKPDGVHGVGTKVEEDWFIQHNIDARALTTALWNNKHSLEKMAAVLSVHRQRGLRGQS